MFSNRRQSFLFAYSAKILLFTLAVAVLLRLLFVSTFAIQTNAMSPTLEPGEFVLAWKTFVPHRGDVVILGCPGNDNSTCIKRIVGLPGDRIEVIKQRLVVNDQPAEYEKLESEGRDLNLLERWQAPGRSYHRSWRISVDSDTPAEMKPVVVPPEHVFLLNDRRSDPSDSRQWGVVPASTLEAKAWRIWMSIDWAKSSLNWRRLLKRID